MSQVRMLTEKLVIYCFSGNLVAHNPWGHGFSSRPAVGGRRDDASTGSIAKTPLSVCRKR